MSAPTLPAFLDRAACSRLLGLSRVDVERLFQRCPVHALDGSRKVYVSAEDALAQIRAYPKDAVRRSWEAA